MAVARTKLTAAQRTREVDRRLEERFGGTARTLCALEHRNAFELLVATILSAQCTDVRVNEVTPALFDRFPTPESMAGARREELEALIRPTGFFRSKADHLLGAAQLLTTEFHGEVPRTMEALRSLPGVGRKTANVVRSVDFDEPGLPVDTHVLRLSHRLDLARSAVPEGVERTLCRSVEPQRWGAFSIRLILHGRETCMARAPRCGDCVLEDLCPRRGVRVRPAPGR